MKEVDEKERKHAAKHDKFTLSEINDLGGVVNNGETEPDKCVNRTC